MIGIGKAIIRLSKLISTVFFIAFTAIEVLKNWVKYLKIGLAQGLPTMPNLPLYSLKAIISPYIG